MLGGSYKWNQNFAVDNQFGFSLGTALRNCQFISYADLRQPCISYGSSIQMWAFSLFTLVPCYQGLPFSAFNSLRAPVKPSLWPASMPSPLLSLPPGTPTHLLPPQSLFLELKVSPPPSDSSATKPNKVQIHTHSHPHYQHYCLVSTSNVIKQLLSSDEQVLRRHKYGPE